MPRAQQFTDEQLLCLAGPAAHAELAREFGCSDMPIRRWRQKNGWVGNRAAASPKAEHPLGTPGITTHGDASTVTSHAIDAEAIKAAGGAEAYLRERWGFPADAWHCTSATGNEWLGQRSAKLGGGAVLLGQVKGSFVPRAALAAILPRPAAWTGPKYRSQSSARFAGEAWQMVLTSDHQAPYHNEAKLHAFCAMLHDLRPARIGHLGDAGDYTNISKHPDHAVVKAAVDECTDGVVAIMHAIREAAPQARIEMLAGNHDVRVFTELLLRAERMAGIRSGNLPGSPGRKLLDFRDLWRLDDLGIELVEDPRGWKHARIEIVPGPCGLDAMHGYLTGDHVAAKSLAATGKSVIVGHTHRREHVYYWNKSLQVEQQAAVVGCSCETRGGGGKHFPDFVPDDRWTPGDIVVTVHPDGEFVIEHARWNGERLILGSRSWA